MGTIKKSQEVIVCTVCQALNDSNRAALERGCFVCTKPLERGTRARVLYGGSNLILDHVEARDMYKGLRRKLTWTISNGKVLMCCPLCGEIICTPKESFTRGKTLSGDAMGFLQRSACLVCGICGMHLFPSLEDWDEAIKKEKEKSHE